MRCGLDMWSGRMRRLGLGYVKIWRIVCAMTGEEALHFPLYIILMCLTDDLT